MRLHELTQAEELALEEGWKQTLAGLTAAGLMAGTANVAPSTGVSTHQPHKQEVQQQVDPAVTARQNEIHKSLWMKNAEPEVEPEPEVATVTNNPNEKVLRKAADAAGIQGVELAAFLAQCAHESFVFKRLEERGTTRFDRYEPGHPSGLAKILGNTKKGDGRKFKGRGFIQLTGRWNYTKAAKQTGLDLVNNPELAAEPGPAAALAVWYWKFRVQPRVKNFDDVKKVTKPINSRLHGLEDRAKKFEVFKKALT